MKEIEQLIFAIMHELLQPTPGSVVDVEGVLKRLVTKAEEQSDD